MVYTVLVMIFLWEGGQLWKPYILPNQSHYKNILVTAAFLEAQEIAHQQHFSVHD